MRTSARYSKRTLLIQHLASCYLQLHWLTNWFEASSDLGRLLRQNLQYLPCGPTDYCNSGEGPGAETVGASPCPLLLGTLAGVPPPASVALCLRSSAAGDHSAHMCSRSKHQGINCPWEQASTDDSSKPEDKYASSPITHSGKP